MPIYEKPTFDEFGQALSDIYHPRGGIRIPPSEVPFPFSFFGFRSLGYGRTTRFRIVLCLAITAAVLYLLVNEASATALSLSILLNGTLLLSNAATAQLWLIAVYRSTRRAAVARHVPRVFFFVGAVLLLGIILGRPPQQGALLAFSVGGSSIALVTWSRFFFSIGTPPAVERETFRGQGLVDLRLAMMRTRQALDPDEDALAWGLAGLPPSAATQHFLVVGAPGSGKTLQLKFLMAQVVRYQMARAPDVRALVYDAKQDILGFLLPLAKGRFPVITLHPFDARGVAWDIARDISSSAAAQQLATTMIPKNATASQPFFDNAAREILDGIIATLIRIAPGKWTLRDVVLAGRDPRLMRALFQKFPARAATLEAYLSNERGGADILSTLRTHLYDFAVVAASLSHAKKRASIEDWLAGAGVLVLGNSDRSRAAVDALNRLFLARLGDLLLDGPEVNPRKETKRTWLFLDEFRELGKLDTFHSLLTKSRSKGCCIVMGFQDISGLRDLYGENRANEIAGLPANKCFLRIEDEKTADWASSTLGKVELLHHQTSTSESTTSTRTHQGRSSSKSRSTSQSRAYSETATVLPNELMTIPQTSLEAGLTGIYRSPLTGAYSCTWPGKLFEELAPTLSDEPNFKPRPPEHEELEPWDKDDLARLGLEGLDVEASSMPSATAVGPKTGGGSGLGILGGITR